jgi:NAD(P)-dependent dehydrogenase (short-subunit alcohol dehydrogenase family)
MLLRLETLLYLAMGEIGSNVVAIQADSSGLSDLDRVYDTIEAQKGRVDIVVGNAGILEKAKIGYIIARSIYLPMLKRADYLIWQQSPKIGKHTLRKSLGASQLNFLLKRIADRV